jgi:hypothetical protein
LGALIAMAAIAALRSRRKSSPEFHEPEKVYAARNSPN